MPNAKTKSGFSLVELLIALVILGVVSLFTIPKLFNTPSSTRNSKQTAVAKETAFMILNAYEQYRTANATITTNTTPGALTPYMNYVSLDTSGTKVDAHPLWVGESGSGRNTCNVSTPCLKLHNGGSLYLYNSTSFGCATSLCLIEFSFDPDAVTAGNTADSITKALQFELYYDGTIRSRGQTKPGSCDSTGCGSLEPNSSIDPSWFSGF